MQTLNKNIQKLTKLCEQSQNKKLLWEEMQLISKKAFEIQDEIMAELDRAEALEQDIVKVQAAFAARESIWNLMNQITERELELKAKAHHKETEAEREKRHADFRAENNEHHCCCHEHHHEGCCHHHEEHCAGQDGCSKRKKKCKKK